MEWHINDLSLHGQFPDIHHFRLALEPILRSRSRRPVLAAKLFASRSLSDRPVTSTATLQQAVRGLSDQNFTRQVLEWLAKSGPFWEDERTDHEDDYFEYNGSDVTNQGLGESARRRIRGLTASSFSFRSPDFEVSPLIVQHGLSESPLGYVEVPNSWDLEQLEAATATAARSWATMIASIRETCPNLVLSQEIGEELRPHPFDSVIEESVLELANVLQSITTNIDPDSALTETGRELLKLYFQGHRPWFTDSSEPEKRQFKSDLTFKDPSGNGTSLVCFWHGKIQRNQYRIHFEWPRPSGQREIKVVYIGPKITKR